MARVKLRRPEPFSPPAGSYVIGRGAQRFVGKRDRIWLTPGLAASHCLVVGQTGSGKSKWAEGVCRQFLTRGQGFALLDLHGDLATDLRAFAATVGGERGDELRARLVWLDPSDPDRVATFNPLAVRDGSSAATQILELVAAFRRNWSDSWGPRLADLLTHTLGVLQANALTLAEVPLLLGDANVRRRLLRTDGIPAATRDYFDLRFNPLSVRDRVLMSESTANKVGAFLADERVRTFIGDTKPTFDPHRAIARQEVVLARIPRGALVENADVLAGLLLASFHTAALGRVHQAPEARRPYVLVLDEAQIASDSFPQLLSGSRAFGLSAICGVQYLELVPRPLAEALLANCRVRICFRVGRSDAERLGRELFRADADHVKFLERDLLGTRKSKPIYWSVQEELEYVCRELQDQGTGECVIQLDRELPWFAETEIVGPAIPDDEQRLRLNRHLTRRMRRRADLARALIARREHLTNDSLTRPLKGGDFNDEDDAVEALA